MPKYNPKYKQPAKGRLGLLSPLLTRLRAAVAGILQRSKPDNRTIFKAAALSRQRNEKIKKLPANTAQILFLALLLAIAGWLGFQTVNQSDIFKSRSISVHGNRITQQTEILDLGRIEPGMSLLSLDINLAEERISKHLWIDRVTIKRNWPLSIEIQIYERRPLAMINIENKNNGLYYVDKKGDIFAPVNDTMGLDFPVITGINLTGRVVGANINDQILPSQALSFFRIANRGNPVISLQSISEINVHSEKGIIVYLAEHPFPIYMGHDKIKTRYYLLVKLLERLYRKKKINDIEEIRLDYQEGRILVARATP